MRVAVVIGSTGLVGRLLVGKLARQGSWSQVLAIARKEALFDHPKVRTIRFDFLSWDNLDLQISSFAGASASFDFFCALGTTIKSAGNEAAFKKIDHAAVVEFSKLAVRRHAESLLIVSSLGADANSKNFYLKTKGEMEIDVQKIKSKNTYFLRPSLLLGDRDDFRFTERFAAIASSLFSFTLIGRLKKYRPIRAERVAQAMVQISAKKKTAENFVENASLHEI